MYARLNPLIDHARMKIILNDIMVHDRVFWFEFSIDFHINDIHPLDLWRMFSMMAKLPSERGKN